MNKTIATDTVFCDVLAIDNDSCSAQLYVGTKSLFADFYGIKTQGTFINFLLDIIQGCGSPTKLISNRADNLCYLHIAYLQSEAHHQH